VGNSTAKLLDLPPDLATRIEVRFFDGKVGFRILPGAANDPVERSNLKCQIAGLLAKRPRPTLAERIEREQASVSTIPSEEERWQRKLDDDLDRLLGELTELEDQE
jgi:hypothetical protein